MKAKTLAIIGMMLAAAVGWSAPAPYPLTINSRAQTAPDVLVYRASQAQFDLTFKDGATASDLTGHTVWMSWSTNASAATVSTGTVTITTATSGTARATFSASAMNYAAGRYIYEVGATSNSVISVYRQGVMEIKGSPYATGGSGVQWTTNYPWSLISGTPTTVAGYGITDAMSTALTNGWVVSSHDSLVADTDTNGWVVSAHSAWLTAETDPVFATNGVTKGNTNGWEVSSHSSLVADSDTNGWVVGSHAAFLTAEADTLATVLARGANANQVTITNAPAIYGDSQLDLWNKPGLPNSYVQLYDTFGEYAAFSNYVYIIDSGVYIGSRTNATYNPSARGVYQRIGYRTGAYVDYLMWSNGLAYSGGNLVATNAGGSGAGYFAQSNGVWTGFSIPVAAAGADVFAASNNVFTGSNTFSGAVVMGPQLVIGTTGTTVSIGGATITAGKANTVAIGAGATVSDTASTAIGALASCGTEGLAIGKSAAAVATATAVGPRADAYSSGVSIGYDAGVPGTLNAEAIAIGESAQAYQYGVAVGGYVGTAAYAKYAAIAIGASAVANGGTNVTIGFNINNPVANSVRIGQNGDMWIKYYVNTSNYIYETYQSTQKVTYCNVNGTVATNFTNLYY